jgi:hypothetical protein
MVSFGCDKFDTRHLHRLVPEIYVRTLELFVLKISSGFVNLIIWALSTTDDTDYQLLEPLITTGLDGAVGWLLLNFWKPSLAGFGHFGQGEIRKNKYEFRSNPSPQIRIIA